jgi:hypothetical protein
MVSNLYFIGMSKNCFNSLKSNIEFLLKFKDFTSHNIDICIIDSDSSDGTKEYCYELYEQKFINQIIEIDNLEKEYSSRIERLTICRNEGLNYIGKMIDKEALYIPMDMDLDLFSLTSFEELEKIINTFISRDNFDGLFPFSVPHYYDIFALRATGWVNGNNLLTARKLKDKFKIFSVIFNYFLIFRKQKHIEKFNEPFISVESAFGGMGLYKMGVKEFENYKYDINVDNINYYSEHIVFNNFFKNLYISCEWKFPSPMEYTFFNNFTFLEKITYIMKTLKNDFKNI